MPHRLPIQLQVSCITVWLEEAIKFLAVAQMNPFSNSNYRLAEGLRRANQFEKRNRSREITASFGSRVGVRLRSQRREVRRVIQRLRSGQLSKYNKAGAAVFDSALFGLFETSRRFFTVANGHQPFGIDALVNKKIFRDLGAFRSQRQVILGGANIVTVALDFDARLRMGFHPVRILLEDFLRVGG